MDSVAESPETLPHEFIRQQKNTVSAAMDQKAPPPERPAFLRFRRLDGSGFRGFCRLDGLGHVPEAVKVLGEKAHGERVRGLRVVSAIAVCGTDDQIQTAVRHDCRPGQNDVDDGRDRDLHMACLRSQGRDAFVVDGD